ncbi:ATP-binding cassette transporter [Clonorchis sinensis]|uniref:ATP-binding cassette transporter n=1 Tax=Clonorchis sinensis TaxID=79923 RepID=G7YQB1_CLOSI|nr:ATP-binding cassette transporter [Clonorchis sinensis]
MVTLPTRLTTRSGTFVMFSDSPQSTTSAPGSPVCVTSCLRQKARPSLLIKRQQETKIAQKRARRGTKSTFDVSNLKVAHRALNQPSTLYQMESQSSEESEGTTQNRWHAIFNLLIHQANRIELTIYANVVKSSLIKATSHWLASLWNDDRVITFHCYGPTILPDEQAPLHSKERGQPEHRNSCILRCNIVRCTQTSQTSLSHCKAIGHREQTKLAEPAARTPAGRHDIEYKWPLVKTIQSATQGRNVCLRTPPFLETRRQIPPGRNHNSTRRIIRRQVKLSVRADREAWWTRKAEELEDAKNAGNVRRLFHLIRSTGPRKPLVSEIIRDQNGSLMCNKGERLDRWAQYFERQFSWPPATFNPETNWPKAPKEGQEFMEETLFHRHRHTYHTVKRSFCTKKIFLDRWTECRCSRIRGSAAVYVSKRLHLIGFRDLQKLPLFPLALHYLAFKGLACAVVLVICQYTFSSINQCYQLKSQFRCFLFNCRTGIAFNIRYPSQRQNCSRLGHTLTLRTGIVFYITLK